MIWIFCQKIPFYAAPIPGPITGFHPPCLLLGPEMVADVDSVHQTSAKSFHFTSVFSVQFLNGNNFADPEYQFVAGSNMARPFKTKGAIGIRFRLLQSECVFIACHLTRQSWILKFTEHLHFQMANWKGELLTIAKLQRNSTLNHWQNVGLNS